MSSFGFLCLPVLWLANMASREDFLEDSLWIVEIINAINLDHFLLDPPTPRILINIYIGGLVMHGYVAAATAV
jgi:hypothetical protein